MWPHKNVISSPKFYNRIQYNKYQGRCRLRPNVQPAALQQDGINRTCGHEATLRVRWPQPWYVTPNTVSGDPKQEDGASLNPFHTKNTGNENLNEILFVHSKTQVWKKWRPKVLFLREKCGRRFTTIVIELKNISSTRTHLPSSVQEGFTQLLLRSLYNKICNFLILLFIWIYMYIYLSW